MTAAAPLVSVIMPVRNEAGHLESVVGSLLRQDQTGFELELLLVDGASEDGSRDILERLATAEPRLRIIDNPRRRTPFALNLGIQAARGDYVAILGAHADYDRDYLRVCLDELRTLGVTGTSGRVIVEALSDRAADRLNCWAICHPFGSSSRSFRTLPEGPAESLPYPLFRRDALLDIGSYDERLLRNQDNDLNHRLRQAGHGLHLTWRTGCRYRFRPGLRGLLRYASTNGRWVAVSLRLSPRSMQFHHLAPLGFVLWLLLAPLAAAFLIGSGTTGLWVMALALGPLLLHPLIGQLIGLRMALREGTPLPLLLPWWFLLLHLSYGWGTLQGLLALGRPPRED